MTTSLTNSLPEHWTELNAARKQRRLCSEDVEAIKKSCATDHGTRHIAECPDCYGKAIDRMFGRYNDSQDREWFSQRRAVVLGLEDTFAEAKARKRDLKDIENNIESEKEAWYRWVLRRYSDFLAVADSGVDQDEVRSTLDDPDRSREELVAMVWQAVGKPDDWSARIDAFADKVATAGQDTAQLKTLFTEEFFKDPKTGQTLDNAQEYLQMYESSPEVRLEDIIDKIISANKEVRSSQAQRDNHQKRLDELRRAKTAFEQNKVRVKSQRQEAQTNSVPERFYDLPSCAECQKEVDSKDVISCSLCQMLNQIGGDEALTVFCSEACFSKGQVCFPLGYHKFLTSFYLEQLLRRLRARM